ncbi:hypothetical protein GCM10027610_052080 [Dactylosporangium cerinum]
MLWAKTVGTAGVPIFDGAPSPSGTAQPHFHAIDAFLERRDFGSMVGQQSVYLAGFFPRHWRELVAALREVSVRQYVERTRNQALRGVYNAVLDAYAGDRGWMGLHRVKAYGFLEVAFKVGRQVTTGARFTGLFKDRTWDRVDVELAVVRDERRPPVGPPVVFGTARRGRVVTADGGAWTCYLELDVTGQGVQHQPGDRVGILAEHDDDLVTRTVAALQAGGDELVRLTPAWQAAVACRAGYDGDVDVLPLRTLLRFARLRPIGRDVAKRLARLSAVGSWGRIVDARMEEQWELWDVLNLLHAGGWDVTRLWKADPGEPEAFCAVIPPEPFRLYSIASAAPPGGPVTTLQLVVAGLEYTSARTPWSYPRGRRGAASHFLRRAGMEGRARLSLRIVPTPRFRLPVDPARPVIMFAAGSGVAPFLAFVAARAEAAGSTAADRLYWGLRTPAEFVERDGLDAAAAAGRLRLHVAFSRADTAAGFDGQRHVTRDGSRHRVDDAVRADAEALQELLRPVEDGGAGAHVYICGSAYFAAAVVRALAEIAPGDGRSSCAASSPRDGSARTSSRPTSATPSRGRGSTCRTSRAATPRRRGTGWPSAAPCSTSASSCTCTSAARTSSVTTPASTPPPPTARCCTTRMPRSMHNWRCITSATCAGCASEPAGASCSPRRGCARCPWRSCSGPGCVSCTSSSAWRTRYAPTTASPLPPRRPARTRRS